ncbi:MAG TPA: 4'-phosphopantetheinyl transferase superfamily protein [Pyrinomonadaceae bacterium]|nr:4'-phosphopantetheinyl transferase superfamily protein [Pyrinomonadaceae bacterium]
MTRYALEPGEVHVWRTELVQPDEVLHKFWPTLNADEAQRANRFHFEEHRRGFVVARGFLREVLSRYLDAKPESLQFSYSAYGKPALNGEHKGTRLRFNLSHSHNLALLAVTEDSEIGVDVEYMRADFAGADIARRFFSRAEVATFDALAEKDRVAAFFRCWTRKEAFIKATGKGMSQALDAFDVTLAPGVAAELLRVDQEDASRWFLSDIEIDSGYAAALAVEGRVSKIKLL